MKKIIEEVSGEGLESLLGKTVILFCCNYFYTGKLIGVNTDDVLLEEPMIVYDTGNMSESGWDDVQRTCCKEQYVRTLAIESYGKVE